MICEELINNLGHEVIIGGDKWYCVRIEMYVFGTYDGIDVPVYEVAPFTPSNTDELDIAIAFIKENHDAIFADHALNDESFVRKLIEANIIVPFIYEKPGNTITKIELKHMCSPNKPVEKYSLRN